MADGVSSKCVQGARGYTNWNCCTPPLTSQSESPIALAKTRFHPLNRGRPSGLVFFIDGDKAYTPMPVPDKLLSLMDDVATAKINHEGSGL